jgi:hypothetical protein
MHAVQMGLGADAAREKATAWVAAANNAASNRITNVILLRCFRFKSGRSISTAIKPFRNHQGPALTQLCVSHHLDG